MNDNDKPQCRSCGAAIFWATTEKGRRMPIDTEPKIGGNIVLIDQGRHKPPLAHVVTVNDSTPRYTSHFATCPQAKQHRRTEH